MDINELYDRDPLSLTKDDISALISDLRRRREAFNAGAKQAGNMKPKPAPKEVKPLDLGALGLLK